MSTPRAPGARTTGDGTTAGRLLARLIGTLDLRAGLIGALLMGGLVFWINASHGGLPATTAAAKQFAYTFFMGGWVVRLCSTLARRPRSDGLGIALGVAIPSLVTIGATLVVHSLRGTPEPLASTIPVAVLSPPSFGVWAWRERRAVAATDPRALPSANPPDAAT